MAGRPKIAAEGIWQSLLAHQKAWDDTGDSIPYVGLASFVLAGLVSAYVTLFPPSINCFIVFQGFQSAEPVYGCLAW